MKHIKIISLLLSAALLISALIFPINNIAEYDSETEAVSCISQGEEQSAYCDNDTAGTTVSSRFLELFFGKAGKNKSSEKSKSNKGMLLIPSGNAFGVKISGSGVRVMHTAEINEYECPLIENDRIEKINGTKVYTTEDVKNIISKSGGKSLLLDIIRDGKHLSLNATPRLVGAEYSLGVIISDGASGIGTITYIDPTSGCFGGLGHGICDSKSGEVLNMTSGEATTVILGGAVKGAAGAPGELRGVLTDKHLGTIEANTECGVFGKFTADAVNSLTENSTLYEVADRSQVHEGEATVISTVKNGRCGEYKIRIQSIDRDSDGTKSFRIKVTDDTLTALTGGIVRGMSGSPIIQDGKLIGAVTHVMVADPTEGYGIFIENMLNAANNQSQQKAA